MVFVCLLLSVKFSFLSVSAKGYFLFTKRFVIQQNFRKSPTFFLQVTFIEALDQLIPGFDPEISKLAGSKGSD